MTKSTNRNRKHPGKSGLGIKTYDTDKLAIDVYLCLLRDFRAVHGSQFGKRAEKALLTGIADFRDFTPPSPLGTKPDFFRARYQVDSLLKKYRFAADVYSDGDLRELSLRGYFDDQIRLAAPRAPYKELSYRVFQEARKICRSILGKFPKDELVDVARFGRKSSIGCPLSLAHIDEKLSNVKAFSSSKKISEWFQHEVLSNDIVLERILKRVLFDSGPFVYSEIESLALKDVPKSWKILRIITPLALLNLFYSHGYGELVTERLNAVRLRIRYLQSRHRALVKEFSLDGTHATVDFSRASDSILSEHLNRVLPRDWYVGLKPILTHQLVYADLDGQQKEAYTASVLPMGNGATFPLETLVFYCITKAMGNLARVHGIFSVYGDDIIYPSALHRYATVVFSDIGFLLNKEKTHAVGDFRESCGADCYRGVDVRPFTFPGAHQILPRSKYIAFLYKVYNGLVRRWDPLEVRGTLFHILRELALTGCQIMRVPPSYPDTAGLHVNRPDEVPLGLNLLPWSPISAVFEKGSIWYTFSYMVERAKDRYVRYVEPYYWLALQGIDDAVDDVSYAKPIGLSDDAWLKQRRQRYIDELLVRKRDVGIAANPILTWKKHREYRTHWNWKKKKTVRKKVLWYRPTVAEKLQTVMTESTGSVTFWT